MKGHTRQRGKTWCAIVDVGTDDNGKRKQRWISGFKTKKLAEIALVEEIGKMHAGTYVAPAASTVREFLTDWIAAQTNIRPSTLASYELNLRRHVVPRLGGTKLQSLTSAQIGSLYAELLDHGRTDGKGGLSAQTVKYIAMILKQTLSDAVRQQLLIRNPADAIDAPRRVRGAEMKIWAPEQLREFLAGVKDEPLYAAYVVAATTGMRRGEVLGLRWSDVDLEKGRLSIQQTVLAVGYAVQMSSPKTARGRRMISIDGTTIEALRQHRARQAEIIMQLGPDYRRDLNLVFSGVTGDPLHPERMTRTFERLVKASGLPRIRLHDLRHTAASIMLGAGVPAKVASERLGHANISITLDTYSHVLPGLQEDAAEKLAAAVFGG